MAVNFDEHEIDCLSDEVRDEIARGQVMAEAAIAACELGRKHDAETHRIDLDDKNRQLAEVPALKVKADLFTATAVVAAIAILSQIATGIAVALKK